MHDRVRMIARKPEPIHQSVPFFYIPWPESRRADNCFSFFIFRTRRRVKNKPITIPQKPIARKMMVTADTLSPAKEDDVQRMQEPIRTATMIRPRIA